MRHLSITYQDGLTERSRSLREHLLVQVHQRGVVAVAGSMDMAPSKLTEKMAGQDSGGKSRGMTIDELETYIRTQGDISPIHYLIERYMTSPEAAHAEAIAELTKLATALPALLQRAGVKWP
ncbi:hypothetical protein D3C81_170000 [compost metagenome]